MHSPGHNVRFLGALFVILSVVGTGRSATLTYTGFDDPRGTQVNSNAAFNAFTATLSVFGVDDIDGIDAFKPDPLLTFGSTGINAQTDVNFVAPFLSVSGANSLYDAGPGSPTGAAINDTFDFNQPVTAFGFYATNVGDGTSVSNTISLILENTLLGTSKVVSIGTFGPGTAQNSTLFFGVTDTDAFNKVTLVETFDYDGLLLDNITAGQVAVPEASSILLVSAAALAATYLIRNHGRSARAA